MNGQLSSSSSTGAPIPSDSSSLPQNPFQNFPQGAQRQSNEDKISWWQRPEAIIALMGMALTGVIGYFSAVITMKDSISLNTSKINVIEEQIKNAEWKLSNINNDVAKIHSLEKEVAVLQTKVESNSKDIEKNTKR